MSDVVKTKSNEVSCLTIKGSKQLITREIWRHYCIIKNLSDSDMEKFLEKHKNNLIIVGLNGYNDGDINSGEVHKTDYDGQFNIKDRVYFHSNSVLTGQSNYEAHFFIAYVYNKDCYREKSEVPDKPKEQAIIKPVQAMNIEIKSIPELSSNLNQINTPYDYSDPEYSNDDDGEILGEYDITISEPEYWCDDNRDNNEEDLTTKYELTSAAIKTQTKFEKKQIRERIPLDEFRKRMDAVRENERQSGIPGWQINAVDYFYTLTSKTGKYKFSTEKAYTEILKKYSQLKGISEFSRMLQARRKRMKGIANKAS